MILLRGSIFLVWESSAFPVRIFQRSHYLMPPAPACNRWWGPAISRAHRLPGHVPLMEKRVAPNTTAYREVQSTCHKKKEREKSFVPMRASLFIAYLDRRFGSRDPAVKDLLNLNWRVARHFVSGWNGNLHNTRIVSRDRVVYTRISCCVII